MCLETGPVSAGEFIQEGRSPEGGRGGKGPRKGNRGNWGTVG